jgi:hypothetical protein
MIFGDSMVVGRFFGQDEIYSGGSSARCANAGCPWSDQRGACRLFDGPGLLLMERWVPTYRPDVVIYGSTLNDYGGNSLEHRLRGSEAVVPPRRRAAAAALAAEAAREDRELRTGARRWLQTRRSTRSCSRGSSCCARGCSGSRSGSCSAPSRAVHRNATVAELDWKLYEALVVRMEQDARKFGARFVFFAHPEVGEVWSPTSRACASSFSGRKEYDPFTMERRLIEMAHRRNLEFLPLIQAFPRPERARPVPPDPGGRAPESGRARAARGDSRRAPRAGTRRAQAEAH